MTPESNDPFRLAARAVGSAPAEMLHVGDDYQLDVAGALNAGLHQVTSGAAALGWLRPGISVARF